MRVIPVMTKFELEGERYKFLLVREGSNERRWFRVRKASDPPGLFHQRLDDLTNALITVRWEAEQAR